MLEPAYIAGFFDGEGCVYVAPDSAYLQVEIAQNDRRPLDLIACVYGGKVRRHKTRLHKWYCPASSVERFLTDIIPFLIVKKSQAEFALAFRELKCRGNGRGDHQKRNVALFQRRDEIAARIKAAKHESPGC